MSNQKIILTTKGNISGSDKQALRRAGVCIAEVKDINAVKIISGIEYFEIDDITSSALETIKLANSDAVRERFAFRMLTKITEKKIAVKPT